MKRLILIQNDAGSTGKTTLTHAIERYLVQHGVAHQTAFLADADDDLDASDRNVIEVSDLNGPDFLSLIDQQPITLLEISTGLGTAFADFYESSDMENVLNEIGCELSVVIPVTGEPDTFETVTQCAEVYSDAAEYTIAHLVTSSYDDEDSVWDRSYAARVMDLFEAVELYMPEVGFQLEMDLRNHHLDMSSALRETAASDLLGRGFTTWLNKTMSQVESARQYLFGDAFIPTAAPAKPKARRRSRAK